MKLHTVLLLFLPLLSSPLSAKTITELPPTQVDLSKKYIFYSHGFIVEGNNAKPVHKVWGEYDFPAIKNALAGDNIHVIARHRSKNTDPYEYANHLAQEVKYLLSQGVKNSDITLVGFSRGAFITALTSNMLKQEQVNTVLLAGCGRILKNKYNAKLLYGHVLSIFEKSDVAQSCEKIANRSVNALSFQEISFETGLEHGAFYRPVNEWVKPLMIWIKSR